MNDYILEADNIHKSYPSAGDKLHVLKGLSLKIPKGKIIVVIGPSGAGKSTLLHVLGGLDYPQKGRVLIDNIDIYKINDNKRASIINKKIGFVFQFYHLLPEFTALENAVLPAMIKNTGRLSKRKLNQRAQILLNNVGLSERTHHKPNELSGGEQQRVAVARALMNEPELLLCDEPTGNLDSENSNRLMELLKKLNREKKQTFIIVSHDDSMAEVADKVIKIKDGKFL